MRRKALLDDAQDGLRVMSGLVTRGLGLVAMVVGKVLVLGWTSRVVRAGTGEQAKITH